MNVSYVWTGPNGTTISPVLDDAPFITIENAAVDASGTYTVSVNVDGCWSEVSAPYSLVVNECICVVAVSLT